MVENIAERLSLFKDYSLIPQHVTLEQLKVGMKEKPQRMEFITEIIDNNVRWPSNGRHINKNSNCEVSGEAFFGFKVLLGLSPITGLINRFNLYLGTFGSPLFPYLKSRDLLQLHYASVMGVETKNGAMPSFSVEAGYKARIILFGFVGYYITISPFIPKFLLTFWDAFLGFAEYIEVHWSDYVEP
ncbi:unnamed protein product [marine sediment metagenome]|uniref:Uncharacterized protein n=1 Tax=marine sediment metagenome TaxID=412755 RepID=X1VCE7_9ZZZZ